MSLVEFSFLLRMGKMFTSEIQTDYMTDKANFNFERTSCFMYKLENLAAFLYEYF